MNDEQTPQRPEGMGTNSGAGSPTPRVEVEPTPTESEQGAAQTTQMPDWQHASGQHAAGHDAAGTQNMPFVPTETVTRTVVKTKTKKLPVFLASLAGLAVGAVLVIALVMSGAFRITESNVEATGGDTVQTIDIDAEDTTLAEAVAAKTLPSVVSITTESASGGGIGSGSILDTDGNILTNYHVIEGATSVMVTLSDESSHEAEIVGYDESSDLAVVRLTDVADLSLTPIEIADSDDITVGEWVMAIGSPFGNEQSVSTGIVSALYRSTAMQSSSGTTIYANMIQTDAAINPGNSGGALVNSEGRLIGVNSIIESYSGSSSGVGFAIPVNYAKNIADQIIAGETPAHPYLGVNVSSVNAYTARQENLAVTEGAYIASVNAGTPAEEAGLQQGDIVVAVNGEEVTSADGLIIALREYAVGDTVTLSVVRGTDDTEVEVTLGSDAELQSDQQDSSAGNSSGMTEEELLEYFNRLFGGNGYGDGYGMGESYGYGQGF